MKKLLITLSALAASAAASQAVMIYDSTDPDNPSLMSEWGVWNTETWTLNVSHSNFIWKGSGSTSDNIMKNCYVLVDKDFTYTTGITISGGGGNHNNMNHIMDGTSITYDTSDPLPFNNTIYSEYTTNYSMGFYFTAAPESTGTLNFLRNTTFDLYSQDIKYGGTVLKKFGRVISFGEGITANFSSDLTVGGRNSELTVSDSLFNVAGTMNVAGRIRLDETIANFSGNVSTDGALVVVGTTLGTNLTLTGSLIVSDKTSVATNSSIAVTGSGHFEFNGGLASTWTTQTNNPILVANTAGNVVKEFIYMQEGVGITVTADNDWNTARLLFRGGQGTFSVSDGATLEVASMLSISNVSGKTSKISVEDGSLLIVGSTLGSYEVTSESFVSFGELDGKLNYLNFLNFAEGTVAFKEIGTAEQQSAFLSHIMLNGAFNEDLHFSGFDSGVGGYWLTTAIPEPSTWAAILGAVALGFAAYRRRK